MEYVLGRIVEKLLNIRYICNKKRGKLVSVSKGGKLDFSSHLHTISLPLHEIFN